MTKTSSLSALRAAAILAGFSLVSPQASAQEARLPTEAELRDKAFEAAQWSMIGDAAAAVTRVAASFARGNGEVAELERRREALSHERDLTEARFVEATATGAASAAQDLQDLARIESALTELDRQIEATDPAYAELTRPAALRRQQVQQLLNPDEALVLFLANDEATYTFAVTREGISWARATTMTGAALRDQVDKLRAQLAVDRARGLEREDNVRSDFDRSSAYDLYRQLLQPVEGALAGKTTLLTVADGPLAELPLQVLVTEAPTGSNADPAALRDTNWLAEKYRLASLPAVSSLHALRCLLVPRNERHPGCQGSSSAERSRRNSGQASFAGFGAPVLNGKPVEPQAVLPTFESVFTGRLADPARLRSLAELPGSAAELQAIGNQFANRATVLTGAQATEAAVKASSAMRSARYVVFSTHGLLAAEAGLVGEPGLVFTPPADGAASAQDDGLLTASEAAALQLSADLVVLSACNTAAPAGGGSQEGLSGLARAFLFAGARSMMVSHWPVDDAATARLMLTTFEGLDEAKLGRAEALRVAMRELRQDPRFASPAFWAPFTLVGLP